jgi:erythronate-4-phosphate dehydrogenase
VSQEDADVLIVRSRTKVNQALLQDSQVKFVGSTVAGLEHVSENIGIFFLGLNRTMI